MAEISKNDAVGFANSILAMQKEIADLKAEKARLIERYGEIVDLVWDIATAAEKIKSIMGGHGVSRNPTSASGRSDENDHKIVGTATWDMKDYHVGQCSVCHKEAVVPNTSKGDPVCFSCASVLDRDKKEAAKQ